MHTDGKSVNRQINEINSPRLRTCSYTRAECSCFRDDKKIRSNGIGEKNGKIITADTSRVLSTINR